MSQIDFRLLQSAIVLAEELNFSRAASRLYLTQPGLTKQIQDLESNLGVILFDRTSQGVELTEPCRTFIEQAKLAIFHLNRAVHLTRASANGVEAIVNFGSSPYVDPYVVSTLMSVRLPLYPTMRVHSHSNFSPELVRQVSSGELDIALVAFSGPNARLNFLEIANHPLYALMRETELSAQKRAVTLQDFDGRAWVLFARHTHPVLHDQIFARAQDLGVRPSEVHYITVPEEAAHLVVKHDGIAFISRSGAWRVACGELTMRPLGDATIGVKTMLVTRSEDRTRLTSEYVRAAMRKLQPKRTSSQQTLPLTA